MDKNICMAFAKNKIDEAEELIDRDGSEDFTRTAELTIMALHWTMEAWLGAHGMDFHGNWWDLAATFVKQPPSELATELMHCRSLAYRLKFALEENPYDPPSRSSMPLSEWHSLARICVARSKAAITQALLELQAVRSAN